MDKFYIEQLTIIGVGLIGGSIAARLKREGAVGKVVGVGRGRGADRATDQYRARRHTRAPTRLPSLQQHGSTHRFPLPLPP